MNETPSPVFAVQVHEELMTLTIRMVGEHPEFAAGSVMRCVARAFRGAVVAGLPHNEIPAEVERAACRALAKRVDGFAWNGQVSSQAAGRIDTRSTLRRAG